MKHLYLFCQNGVAAGYGVGTYVKQLVLALKNESMQLSVIITQSDKKIFQVEYNASVRYIHIPPVLDMSLSDEEKVCSRRVIAYLVNPHISKDDENIFLFNYLEKADFVELLKHYWPGSRNVYVVHFMDYDGKISASEQAFMNSMDHLVCLSTVTLQKLIREHAIPQNKISLIYNGIEDRYQKVTKEDKLALRRKYFIRPEDKILLFVGRVDLFKGVDLLIEAMRELLIWDEKIRLFIVGDGLLDVYMKKCTPLWSHIFFTGKLPEEELNELYTIVDLGLIPSLQEQCSFVGIEMMMFGLPVIISKVSGLDEMYEDENTFMYKVLPSLRKGSNWDCSEWVNAIKKALSDSEQLTSVCTHSRKRYEEIFGLEKMKNAYLSLFINLLSVK